MLLPSHWHQPPSSEKPLAAMQASLQGNGSYVHLYYDHGQNPSVGDGWQITMCTEPAHQKNLACDPDCSVYQVIQSKARSAYQK